MSDDRREYYLDMIARNAKGYAAALRDTADAIERDLKLFQDEKWGATDAYYSPGQFAAHTIEAITRGIHGQSDARMDLIIMYAASAQSDPPSPQS